MKKIVFINSALDAGGPGRIISFWSNYLFKKNYDVEIVTNVKKKSFYKIKKNIKITSLNIARYNPKNHIKTFLIIKKFFNGRKNQVFIFNKALYILYLYLF